MLLVEDDLVSASALSSILARRGYHVVHAATVAEALALAAAVPTVDTVILDLMLPDGDGVTVLRHLRAVGSAARVIVTSAVHEPARLAAVRALKPDLMLQKPIDLVSLFRVLTPLH